MEEYVELVHLGDSDLRSYLRLGPIHRQKVERIRELERNVGIHYLMGDLDSNLPNIPFNSPVRVGGTLWELCVKLRGDCLREAGYTNVVIDRSISFAIEDYQ